MPFCLQIKHDYKCDIDFIQQFNKNKLILRDLRLGRHIACFCCISPTKIIPNSYRDVLSLSDSFMNESMNCFKFKQFIDSFIDYYDSFNI